MQSNVTKCRQQTCGSIRVEQLCIPLHLGDGRVGDVIMGIVYGSTMSLPQGMDDCPDLMNVGLIRRALILQRGLRWCGGNSIWDIEQFNECWSFLHSGCFNSSCELVINIIIDERAKIIWEWKWLKWDGMFLHWSNIAGLLRISLGEL